MEAGGKGIGRLFPHTLNKGIKNCEGQRSESKPVAKYTRLQKGTSIQMSLLGNGAKLSPIPSKEGLLLIKSMNYEQQI